MKKKNVISLLLSTSMVLSMVTVPSWASEPAEPQPDEQIEQTETPPTGTEAGQEKNGADTIAPEDNQIPADSEPGTEGADSDTPADSEPGTEGTDSDTPTNSEPGTGENDADTPADPKPGTDTPSAGDDQTSTAPETKPDTSEPDPAEYLSFFRFGDCIKIYGIPDQREVVIPSEIDGLPVVEIYDKAGYRLEKLESLTIEEGITKVGFRAFDDCKNLKHVTFPSSLTSIGRGAFSGCSSLTDITFPEKLSTIEGLAFNGCVGLTSITLPPNLTTLENDIFGACHNLSEIILPEKLPPLTSDVFSNIPAGIKFIFPEGITSLDISEMYPLHGTIIFPKTLTELTGELNNNIGYYTKFSYKGNLLEWRKVAGSDHIPEINCLETGFLTEELPDGTAEIVLFTSSDGKIDPTMIIPETIDGKTVTAIGSHVFEKLTTLETVTIPDSVTRIGDYAFSGCTGLKSISIPKLDTHLESVFEGCEILSDIYYGGDRASWDSIAQHAGYSEFATIHTEADKQNPEASGLKYRELEDGTLEVVGYFENDPGAKGRTLVIPASVDGKPVTAIGYGAFAGTSIGRAELPQGLKTIGSAAFKNCKYLTSINLPDTLTEMGESAFLCAYSLAGRMEIPDGINYVDAFSHCYCLTSVKLPKNLKRFQGFEFEDCSGLCDIYMPNTFESFEYPTFGGCSSLTRIILPDTIKKLSANILPNCTNMKEINYQGSEEQAQAIWGSSNFFSPNENLVRYSSGDGLTTAFVIPQEVLTHEVRSDGTVQITGYSCNKDDLVGYLVIPQTIDGKQVTAIGSRAFGGCSKITSVILPEGLKEIGEGAFEDATSISNVYLPKSVTDIGKRAFRGCQSLRSIALPDGITSVKQETFRDCKMLRNVQLPLQLKTIEERAFYFCSALEYVFLPEGVTSLGREAFNGCASIRIPGFRPHFIINFPMSLRSVDDSAYGTIYYPGSEEQYHQISGSDRIYSSCIKYLKSGASDCMTRIEVPQDNHIPEVWHSSTPVKPQVKPQDGTAKLTSAQLDEAARTGAAVQPDLVPQKADGRTVLKVELEKPMPGGVWVKIPVTNCTSTTVAKLVKENSSQELIKTTAMDEGGLLVKLTESSELVFRDNGKQFHDVAGYDWYTQAVGFITAREVFNGTGDGNFRPGDTMTRAMAVQVLHNLLGRPAPTKPNQFVDVPADAWYANAVRWASETGYVVGSGDRFNPNDMITREQLAVMLYRLAGNPKVTDMTMYFDDMDEISSWAKTAMCWAHPEIIQGAGGLLAPQASATRSEVAMMLMRMINLAIL